MKLSIFLPRTELTLFHLITKGRTIIFLEGGMKSFSRQTIFFCVVACANNFFPAASSCKQFFLCLLLLLLLLHLFIYG